METVAWKVTSDTGARIRPSEDTQTLASLSYDFRDSDTPLHNRYPYDTCPQLIGFDESHYLSAAMLPITDSL